MFSRKTADGEFGSRIAPGRRVSGRLIQTLVAMSVGIRRMADHRGSTSNYQPMADLFRRGSERPGLTDAVEKVLEW